MCARRQPFAELNNFQIINLVGMGDTTLPMPPGILLLWSNIASACWKREPKQRPTFVQLDAVFQDAERQLAEGHGAESPPDLARLRVTELRRRCAAAGVPEDEEMISICASS